MDSKVLGYTVYRREMGLGSTGGLVSAKGIYLSKEHCRQALILQAEQYCINKVGCDNFQCGQLDPAVAAQPLVIAEGFLLTRASEDEIHVIRRSKTFWGRVDVESCVFGILPLVQEKLVVYSKDGTVGIIDYGVDAEKFAKAVRRDVPEDDSSIPPKKKFSSAIPSEYSIDMTLLEKFTEQLRVAVAKRADAITKKSPAVIRTDSPTPHEKFAEQLRVAVAKRADAIKKSEQQAADSSDGSTPDVPVPLSDRVEDDNNNRKADDLNFSERQEEATLAHGEKPDTLEEPQLHFVPIDKTDV